MKIGKVLKSTCDSSFIKSQEDIFRLSNHKSLDIRRIFGICSKKLGSAFATMNLRKSTNTEDFLGLRKVLPGMVFHRLVLPRLPFRLFHFSRLSRSRAAFTLPFRFKWDQHDFSSWPTTPMLNVYFEFLYMSKNIGNYSGKYVALGLADKKSQCGVEKKLSLICSEKRSCCCHCPEEK